MVNLQTAKALGLTVPQSILARADEVIEWLVWASVGVHWAVAPCAKSPQRRPCQSWRRKIISGRIAVPGGTRRDEIKQLRLYERLIASAEAKKLQLERAAKARAAADSPAAIERRAARGAISVARDARVAERKATKAATEAREAAELAAEAATREAALKAEHEAREAEYSERIEKQAAMEAEQQAARDARSAARKAKKRTGR